MTIWIYGWHAVLTMLRHRVDGVQRVLVAGALRGHRRRELEALLADNPRLHLEILPAADLDARFQGGVHQGVAALCKSNPEGREADLEALLDALREPPMLLFLDHVQDVRNLGACMRVADGAGLHALVVEKRNSAPLSPAAMKVASGAVANVRLFRVTNLTRTLRAVRDRGLWLFGADQSATLDLYEADFRAPMALVLGAEGHGLRRLVAETCDTLIRIPMRGLASSLNLAVAASVCAYEALRQRGPLLGSSCY